MTNTPLPIDPNGLVLRYRNTTMKIIQSDPTHILCKFDSGAQLCFARGGFSMTDVVSVEVKRATEQTLF